MKNKGLKDRPYRIYTTRCVGYTKIKLWNIKSDTNNSIRTRTQALNVICFRITFDQYNIFRISIFNALICESCYDHQRCVVFLKGMKLIIYQVNWIFFINSFIKWFFKFQRSLILKSNSTYASDKELWVFDHRFRNRSWILLVFLWPADSV